MPDPNPYASPAETSEPDYLMVPGGRLPPPNLTGEGVWRCGPHLVLHRAATLPYRCVLTGWPAVDAIEQSFTYQHQKASVLWLFLSVWAYAIADAATHQEVTLSVPLSQRSFAFRWLAFCVATLMLSGGTVATIFGAASSHGGALPVLGGLVLVCLGVIVIYVSSKTLSLTHADQSYLWFSGAHEDYLAKLDPWPYRVPE